MAESRSEVVAESPKEPSGPTLYRDLPFRGRMLRAAGIAFTIYHLGAVLAGGAVPGVRKFFDPVLGFYADGLRMTNSWGMFGKPPNTTHVRIEIDTKTERNVQVATTSAKGRTLFERIRDTRIRKIQGKLTDEGDRNRFGQPFLDYFCRHPPAGLTDVRVVRAVNDIHELRDDDGKVTRAASSRVLFTRRCSGTAPSKAWLPPPPVTAPPPGGPPPGGEGDL
ncbi:MAG: hypothetical protein HOV80_20860 [Polyangiaceae bacterium]|nr:hypothetical protein [Polyangiaceae bacterium]